MKRDATAWGPTKFFFDKRYVSTVAADYSARVARVSAMAPDLEVAIDRNTQMALKHWHGPS